MRKFLVLTLMVLVGISLGISSLRADEARTIPMKSGVALHAETLIVGHGATVYMITGRATSANAFYSVHDASSLAGIAGSLANTTVKAEGGEATQYDSFDTLSFGSEGLNFDSGIVVSTTTCDVNLLYR